MKRVFAALLLIVLLPFYIMIVLLDRLTSWLLEDERLTNDLSWYIEEIKRRLKKHTNEGE